jgi:hypothetical protein
MIIFEYLLYRYYKMFNIKFVYTKQAVIVTFSLFLSLNIRSVFIISGFPLSKFNDLNIDIISYFAFTFFTFYIYIIKDRLDIVVARFSKENKNMNIFGWVILILYLIISILLNVYF